MTRLRIPPAVVLSILLVGGCSSPNAPAETTDTATTPYLNATELESLQQRAEEGDASAQHDLGFRYSNGDGVPQDFTQAVAWYREAADQGIALAQFNLGAMYAIGQGVPQDYVEAHKWINLGTSRVTDDTQKERAEARSLLAKQMTPAQLAEAQRLAREWQADFEQR